VFASSIGLVERTIGDEFAQLVAHVPELAEVAP
jgi:hypothetical protein